MINILLRLHPDEDFENNAALIDGSVLDSFDILSIIAEINDEFGVSIPPNEIIPENFNSAAALADLVHRLDD
ncbi:MAG: acyl carrier protein [Clostridiales bacterium]|nr:acyl carrier protein [Clostridiales bacterium]